MIVVIGWGNILENILLQITSYVQWCSRKYLGTGAVENISMVLFL